ncbi:MAG: response regulator transcription factor [Cohaesibacteraceae bacterium]|nr:response regulator transcription factor [Cohaesibacteraceae bacterium]MBL4876444.1 response regulator transcription factor [Cohaesibacteraceae bacterium]
MKNVLVIEDHHDARKVIKNVVTKAFTSPIIDDVDTLGAAREKLQNTKYDLVVLDLNLPDGAGEDFILEVLRLQPGVYIVISTIHDESERLITALENGAKGYLLKEQPPAVLVEEFRGILQGKPPLAPAVTRRLLELMRNRSSSAPGENGNSAPKDHASVSHANHAPPVEEAVLTVREKEVLTLLAKGFNRPEVAGILDISKHTVATHIGKIYVKLDVTSRSEAALIARQKGLV